MIFPFLSLGKMEQLAQHIAKHLSPPITVCLHGDLGVGKTTFARHILKTMNPLLDHIPSPTFTLIQSYITPIGHVWHCDFYRLKKAEDLFELGVEDAFHTDICLIEWPEKISPYLPVDRLEIHIKASSPDSRDITIIAKGNVDDLPPF